MLKFFCVVLLSAVIICFGAPNERIVGGYAAVRGQFPFQVSIRNGFDHICGGSIIDENTILTAASCIYNRNAKDLLLVMGTESLTSGGVTYPVNETQYHEGFNPTTFINDIAVIKTKYPIVFDKYIHAVEFLESPLEEGQTVILSGWGWKRDSQIFANDLQYIYLYYLNSDECRIALDNVLPIGDGQICSEPKASKEGPCYGDQGGPLVDYDHKLIGIGSWSSTPCASGKYPDVYSNIATYREWINEHMG